MQDVENVYQEAFYKSKSLNGLFIHDISNLFQIISNSIELCESLLKEKVKIEEILEFFHMITEQLDNGKKLIRNVRNISELEDYEIPLAPVEVLSMLRSVINFTYISFPKKDIDINVISHFSNLYVMANELLSEVFENIITNSINYNNNEVVQIEIIISVIDEHYKNYVKIEVKDNGIGIDDARKEKIFQDTRLKSRNSKGLGIGLSLVNKLIELYGGDVWVENRIKGDLTKGSNFIVLIPLFKKKRVIIDDHWL